MKKLKLLLIFIISVFVLNAQDRNNEDAVIKVNPQMSLFNSKPGELLVKFKSGTVSQMNKVKPSKIVSGISAVDRVLSQYDLDEVEQLLPNDNPNRVMRKAKAYTGETITETSLNQLYRVKVSSASTKSNLELIEELNSLDEVEFAEPNYILSVVGEPVSTQNKLIQTVQKLKTNNISDIYTSEPMYSLQWGIPVIKLDSLWNKPKVKTKRTVIAIIDTGVDTEHPDLKDNIWTNEGEINKITGVDDDGNGFKDDIHGWDFVNQTANVKDFNSHGTHCAGIAAAVGNNGIGITGADPDALIMPIAVMQSNGSGDVATLIKGINYAANNGADIISMSIGGYGYSIALEQALAQAYQTSILVGAAGNDGIAIYQPCSRDIKKAYPLYPGAFTFVLGVQASQPNISEKTGGHLCEWSNYDCDGPVYSAYGEEKLYNYELLAPGAGIISTVPGGQYRTYNGTSMATPMVAGGIATLIDRKEFISQELLWSTLLQSANENVNFNAAYNLTPSPELNVIAIETNDTAKGDGDMRPDAGEYIDIYPTIRNSGGSVDSIFFKLTFDEFEDSTIVQIQNDSMVFGYSLTSYAKMKSKNPIRIQVNPNVVDGRNIKMLLKAWYGNHEGEVKQKLLLNVENGVELGGMLSNDLTLTPDKNYIVTSNLAVPQGIKLKILPGVKMKFKDSKKLFVDGTLEAIGNKDSLIVFTKSDLGISWLGIEIRDNASAIINYAQFEETYGPSDVQPQTFINKPKKTILKNINFINNTTLYTTPGIVESCNFFNNNPRVDAWGIIYNGTVTKYSNFANNLKSSAFRWFKVDSVYNNSFINNPASCDATMQSVFGTIILKPNYYGSNVLKTIKKGIWDFEDDMGYTVFDVSQRLTKPSEKAHGIVWKVVVNGYDAQDAFDSIPPLGVGKHKFEVYFNRPMNKEVTPMIAMGVRPPYTQSAIGEEGSWNEAGDIYTAYYTVKAVGTGEGINRIYVANAKDNENFEIPYENKRFNVIVQASGSMSNGFEATPGLGKVDLKWETPEGYFDDLLGYNMYRYTYVNDSVCSDTILINSSLLMDTVYTDYNVVPGKTYNYMYKVLRTDMTENEFSKVVSSAPLTATKGDANGSLNVDVADVVTTVNYVTNQNPQPFIFDAADVNSDQQIDVLDIVGIINLIIHPQSAPTAKVNSSAIYSVVNNLLYVESPIALGGVQFKIHGNINTTNIQSLEPLNNFEKASQWINDSTYILLAYSMSGKEIPVGKNALLKLGDGAIIDQVVLSDTQGSNVIAVNNQSTNIVKTEGNQLMKTFPNPFNRYLRVPVTISNQSSTQVMLIFTDVLGREIDRIDAGGLKGGCYEYTWTPKSGIHGGIYFCMLQINDKIIQTEKVIYQP